MLATPPRWPDEPDSVPKDQASIQIQIVRRLRFKDKDKKVKMYLREINMILEEQAEDVTSGAVVIASLSPNSARELASWLVDAAQVVEDDGTKP